MLRIAASLSKSTSRSLISPPNSTDLSGHSASDSTSAFASASTNCNPNYHFKQTKVALKQSNTLEGFTKACALVFIKVNHWDVSFRINMVLKWRVCANMLWQFTLRSSSNHFVSLLGDRNRSSLQLLTSRSWIQCGSSQWELHSQFHPNFESLMFGGWKTPKCPFLATVATTSEDGHTNQ